MRVAQFSSGTGSAVAAKLDHERHPDEAQVLLFADVNGEHPDNYRFLHEAAEWIGSPLIILDNNGRTIWDVFRERRFLGNNRVDPCSDELKRPPLRAWLEANCDPASTTVSLGFDWTEEHRMDRARPYWSPWTVAAPLCEEPLMDKAEANALLTEVGIELPWLTRMGFSHANCGGGCVKAGARQWKQLLKVDPAEFARWEREEEGVRVFLGKDVAMLKDRTFGRTRPLTLRMVRERIESQPSMFDDAEWGGCNCMIPDDESVSGFGLSAEACEAVER